MNIESENKGIVEEDEDDYALKDIKDESTPLLGESKSTAEGFENIAGQREGRQGILGKPLAFMDQHFEGNRVMEAIFKTKEDWCCAGFLSNLRSGITVGLVSIPLSISLSLAAHSTPVAGIATAVWAGITASIVASNHFNIVGPTAALSGVLAAAVDSVEDTTILPILAIVSSILIFICWVLKLHRFVRYIPTSVVHGFTLAVAINIALGQLAQGLGVTGLQRHAEFIMNMEELAKHLNRTNLWSTLIYVSSIIILFVATYINKQVPWAVILVIIGCFIGLFQEHSWIGFQHLQLETLTSKYEAVPRAIWAYGDFNLAFFKNLFRPANLVGSIFMILSSSFGIVLIGILETLISARIADSMTGDETDNRREVLGLAAGNLACSLFGGIPATAALARTALNIHSGAKSRVSGVISGITIALIAIAVLPYLGYCPMCIFAAVLFVVAARMIDYHDMYLMARYDIPEFLLLLLTAAVSILKDTALGILVGAGVALLLVADAESVGFNDTSRIKSKNSEVKKDEESFLTEDLDTHMEDHGDILVYHMTGTLNFINSGDHFARLKNYGVGSNAKYIILSFKFIFALDLDGQWTLKQIVEYLRKQKVSVFFSDVSDPQIYRRLNNEVFFRDMVAQGKVFEKSEDAIEYINNTIKE